jgi:serine/threonine-protein kinase
MELVEGGTLAQRLEGTPQPADKAAELVGSLAGAVEVAHRSGIIHRDLKPTNVLLTPDGIPKVTDFGLARRLSGGEDLTASGTILGTPSYMAPEQIRGSSVGSAADVYALGAILYEMLTGRPPFRSDSTLATQMQVLSKDPVRPSLLNGRVPRDLETICLRCLHKEPARRYESAAELAADLRRFLAHEPIRARPVGRLERGLLWGRRHPTRVTVMSFGAVLLCFAMARVVHDQALARERREQEAVWSPRVDGAFAQLRNGDLAQARSLLDQVPDTLSAELRQRVSQARRELLLVEQLDGIRLHRVDITEGRFDRSENRRVTDLAYDDAFRAAGLGSVGDDPGVVAARVQEAAVRLALVGALDDWAYCAADGAREAWLLDVLRRSDPDPSPWRERLRDPALRLDDDTLAQLADDMRASRTTVQLLVGAAERMREGGFDVIPLLTVVQRGHPGDYWANFALGDALWKQDAREAIRYLQAAIAIRPRSSIAHQALGTALRKAGRVEDSIEAYRQAVLVEPDFAEAHGRLGLTLLKYAGNEDEAIPELREAIRLNPELAWAHQVLGIALKDDGRVAEALEVQRETVRRDPRSGLAHQSLGDCLQILGRDREALVAFRTAVELEALPVHHFDLGSCLARLDELEEAELQLRRAIELDPTFEAPKAALRFVLVRVGRGDEALALFRGAIEARRADSLAWDGYAELCAYLGRHDDYRAACEELLERFGDSDEPRACERIGRACLLLPSESRTPLAEAMIDRAIASDPSRNPPGTLPYFQVAKALGEYRRGRFESAIGLLQGDAGRVLTPLPELIRAMALQRTGAVAEARHNLAAAALSFDWSPAAATDHDSWIGHVIRREAEALILPELADLLAGREEPRDDDTRAAMIGACLATDNQAAAARLCERVFSERSGADREQRHRAARAVARAGAGRGADPADGPERERFRGCAREWLRDELTSCTERLETVGEEQREAMRSMMTSWWNDPAFAALRDADAMEQLPPAEQDDCRALWREVEALVQRLEAKE